MRQAVKDGVARNPPAGDAAEAVAAAMWDPEYPGIDVVVQGTTTARSRPSGKRTGGQQVIHQG